MSAIVEHASAWHPPTVALSTDLRACFYCLFRGVKEPATAVVHDARVCVPCCQEHARWRSTGSRLLGHRDCLLGRSGPDDEHVTVLE